jgi:hypothetical protein
MKRLIVLVMLFGALVGWPAAAQDDTATPTPTPEPLPPQPAIEAEHDGDTYEGAQGSACWPVAAGNVECALVLDIEGVDSPLIEVMTGDSVVFAVSEGEDPEAITAELADGTPLDLDEGEYFIDLEPGEHIASVSAEYAGEDDDVWYTTGIFTLSVMEPPTPTPTATPTEKPTETPDEEQITPEETEEEEDTPATPTPAMQLPSPTPEVMDEITPETPTATPDESETGGPDLPQASPTQIPEVTPTPTVPPMPGQPPEASLETGGRVYAPSGYTYCRGLSASADCVSQPTEDFVSRVVVEADAAMVLRVGGVRPDMVRISMYTSDMREQLSVEERRSDALYLYTPPINQPGSYVLAMEVLWQSGRTTYFFEMSIVP